MSQPRDRNPSAISPNHGQTLQTQHGSAPPPSEALTETLLPSAAAATLPVPGAVQSVAGYEIEGELGRGGMGVVYKARQKGLGRLVALKMILHADHASAEERERFQREAKALAELRHESIVQVYEVGEHEGMPFFSLEYVEGGSLDRRLREGPLPARDAAVLVELLADAMQVAHQSGIVHRDLKPANVLLRMRSLADGSALDAARSSRPPILSSPSSPGGSAAAPSRWVPKITDFGLAKKQDEHGLSVSGAVMGTPSYMAPEQAKGLIREIDGRADVYALGAILYECLTGRPPFRAATPMDTMLQVMNDEPVSVRSLQPATPPDLETICLKCLHKEPHRRYASARELADDLGRFLRGEPVLARPVGRLERTWRWCRRNPTTAGLLAAVAVLLVSGAAVSTWFGFQAQARARDALAAEAVAKENAEKERQARAAVQRSEEKVKEALVRVTAKEKEERLAKEKEKAARAVANDRLYASRLRLGQIYWQEGNVVAARERLDETQDRRDSWEHRYLHTLMNHRGQRTFLGHTGDVQSVCFSPDGRRVASASKDRTVKVWDVQTGQEALTLKGHTGYVYSVVFSPDGKRIASASQDQTAKVWDAQTGQEILTLQGHTDDVHSVCFSPDGKRLSSVSQDQTMKVWDASTGQEQRSLKGSSGGRLWLSSDGKRIASQSWDQTVKVWDAQTGHETLTLKGHTRVVHSVVFGPDGKRIASASQDQTVKVWDAQTGQEALTLRGHTSDIQSVCFSPDGKRIASASLDRTVKVWDAQTGKEERTLKGHTGWVLSVAFSPDGKRLASASLDRTVKIWDAHSGQDPLRLQGHTSYVLSVCFSGDGKRIASGSWDNTVKVWDAQSGREALSLKGHTSYVNSVVFSPDGKRIASASQDQTVKVWDAHSGQEALSLKGHTLPVRSVCFSPDGKRIASASHDKTVRVWDAQTGQETLPLKGHTGWVLSVVFSPDGKRIASGSGDHTVKVWDAHSGQEALTLKGHIHNVSSVVFSPDGKRIASGSGDRTVKVWDAATGQETLTLKGHTGYVENVVFSPDGKRIASASQDQTVKVWDAHSGQEALSLKVHTLPVMSVCFSPDGKRLASAIGGYDEKTRRNLGEVQVLDATTGQEALTLRGFTGYAGSVCFSPDGKRLASGDSDATVKVWDTQTGQEQLSLKGHSNFVESVVFSPDGKRLASASGGYVSKTKQWGEVKVWDAQTGKHQLSLKGHSSFVSSVVFSPDGKRLASASQDQTVKVWDAQTGQEQHTFKGHIGYVKSVWFSPDGQRITSLDSVGKQRNWDLATGRPVAAVAEVLLTDSRHSPDGRYFAHVEGSHVEGSMIRILRLPRGTPEERAAGRQWVKPDYHWHADQARQSWQGADWFAAAFHLNRQRPDRPWDADLHVRCAYPLSRLGRTAQAATHYLQAMLLDPHVRPWPLDANAARRGQASAQASEWARALPDLELAAHQPGATLTTWSDLLLARQAAAPRDARTNCREFLDRFENKADGTELLLSSCLVTSCDEADARRLVKLANRLVATRRDPSTLGRLGAALYRAGRFKEAQRTLRESIKAQGKSGTAESRLFLAMTQQRLGRGAEARKALTFVKEWLEGQTFATWQEKERWRLLQEEACQLILTMPRTAE